MIFYLHQYLLDIYCNPRYTVADGECNFKNYCAHKSTEYININDVYLYNRREKGNYGEKAELFLFQIYFVIERKLLTANSHYPKQQHITGSV